MSSTTRLLVILVAVIGFLFDTYELLMLPLIGRAALADILHVAPGDKSIAIWIGRILWIAAVCGGVFGLLGGWMIDRYGRKRIMVASILLYSFSPVAAAFSTELWQFVLFRCTTFVGVCVEMVAAVTWLAELFDDKRSRERAIAWSLAAASLGGLFVTLVYKLVLAVAADLPGIPTAEGASAHAPWRYMLLTGLVPGGVILAMMPKVPESAVWRERKLAGKLKRPSMGALFSPQLKSTTIVMTILSACAYAAAFGALQLTPSQIILARPELAPSRANVATLEKVKLEERTPAQTEEIEVAKKTATRIAEGYTQDIQFWQELGGLAGRIVLALFVTVLPARLLLRAFLMPGAVLFIITYLELVQGSYLIFAGAIFFCGLVTVAQFSFLSEYLPKVYPIHLRGTGAAFATNVGGRMIGTMAALLNTNVLAEAYGGGPLAVAKAAAVIGGVVYLIAFFTSFSLPIVEEKKN